MPDFSFSFPFVCKAWWKGNMWAFVGPMFENSRGLHHRCRLITVNQLDARIDDKRQELINWAISRQILRSFSQQARSHHSLCHFCVWDVFICISRTYPTCHYLFTRPFFFFKLPHPPKKKKICISIYVCLDEF